MRIERMLVSLSLAGLAAAQGLIVLTNNGAVLAAGPATGSLTIGPGRSGLHGLATDGFRLWSCQVTSTGGLLVAIDARTGVVADLAATHDYRALTWDEGTLALYGLRAGAGAFESVDRIDPATGVSTPVASWPVAVPMPCALAVHDGTLFAWDMVAGLIRVDRTAGTGRPVALNGLNGLLLAAFLDTSPDGRLRIGAPLGYACTLAEVDPNTANISHLMLLTSVALVGGVFVGNPRAVLGHACMDANGEATLELLGSGFTGTTCADVSTHHALGTIGAVIFGLGATSWSGHPLPLLLDPLLGTQGCSLYVSIDASLLVGVPLLPPGDLIHRFVVPTAALGSTIYVQHAAFAPVPGLMSWSNGIRFTVAQ